MKKILMISAVMTACLSAGSAAYAQEQNSYGYDVPRMIPTDPVDRAVQQQQAIQRRFNNMEPRGGRDPRGGFYGRATVWPGDYHDALDRGEFPGAGPRVVPRRAWE